MRRSGAVRVDRKVIDRWIDSEWEAGRLRFGAIQINIAGETRYQRSFGYSDEAQTRPVSQDTRFWIASMTKPVTTLAAMVLAGRGELDLEAPVSDFVSGFGDAGVLQPDGSTVPVARAPVILDLMTHMAGLTYGSFGEGEIHRRYQAANVVDYQVRNMTIASRLAMLPLLQQPGTVFEYGMATDILGHIVELVSGQSLAKTFDTMIFKPLGVRTASFAPSPSATAWVPPSPVQQALAPPIATGVSWWSGGAGLFSDTQGYMAFAQMLLDGGAWKGDQIFDKSLIEAMVTDHLPSGASYGDYTQTLGPAAPWPANGLSFGLGLAVRTATHPTIPGNVGEFFWPGASGANFWVDPALGMAVVFLNHESDERVRHRLGLRHAVQSALRLG